MTSSVVFSFLLLWIFFQQGLPDECVEYLYSKSKKLACGDVGPVYAPCRMEQSANTTFPGCCPRLVCPPYYTYLDAYVYTFSLIVSGGQAPMLRGTITPNPVESLLYVSRISPAVLQSLIGK
ncbi:uncharacterized protein LOC126382249 [Pectinophora gossypiella]|uniref:uncharacterized protein LOC126382249 n=1 Tax=Pectinophora gossypiella TaxID=13191 RepID=UPI00214EA7B6|nr:uncharacterized protein LOC126382249 [Pectinophora gossypiella]